MAFDSFTNLKPVIKSLKFKLIPEGRTQDFIDKNGIIKSAKSMDEKMQIMKGYIDEFHRDYISKVLDPDKMKDVFTEDSLREAYELYKTGEKDKLEKTLVKIEKNLHKSITDGEVYKNMEKKEFIKVHLIDFYTGNNDALNIITCFLKNTSSLRSFNEIRKRMYDVNDDKKNGNTIPKRCVEDNLITYFKNIEVWNALNEKLSRGAFMGSDYVAEAKTLMEQTGSDVIDFTLNNYYNFVSQKGIDLYNTFIGGISLEDGTIIKGLNNMINLHNQKCTSDEDKLPLFTVLYKQIMTKKSSFSFIDEMITSDEQVYSMVSGYADMVKECIPTLQDLFENIRDYNLAKIYITNNSHGRISNTLFGKYNIIEDAITEDYNNNHPAKNKETKKYIADRKKYLDSISTYSIKQLNDIIGKGCDISAYFASFEDNVYDFSRCLEEYKRYIKNINNVNFRRSREAKAVVRGLLDSIVEISRFIKTFLPAERPVDIDWDFYNTLLECHEEIDANKGVYNRVRNYATKKDYNKVELPIDFNSSDQFLGGWSNSDVSQGVILLKDNKYYLGVISPEDKSCIIRRPKASSGDIYKLMDYNLLGEPSKCLPKRYMNNTYLNDETNKKLVSDYQDIINKYQARKNGDYEYTHDDEIRLIEYYIVNLKRAGEDKRYNMTLQDAAYYSKEERPLLKFINDISKQNYRINLVDVDASYINGLVDKGSLYLFRIYSRDLGEHSKGTKNLFALYWIALFTEKNLNENIYKLNGGASIQFREKSLDKTFVHKAGVPIENKNKLYDRRTATYSYDIVKDKRFTYDMFSFSVSITVNYTAKDFVKFNTLCNEYIRDNVKDMHIIGISRGIKNLIYYTVIDMNGNIVEHGSLNKIRNEIDNGDRHYAVETDYNALLTAREADNDRKQAEWDSEYTIKDLKDGYISRAIPEIAKLMIKYNAVLCLEDLSGNFKDKQKAIEKTVYTDFENALISKLNLLVTNKDINYTGAGSIFKPYQLSLVPNSKGDLHFQQGFVFFINPAYTSTLDPSTGFINLFDTRYKGKENTKRFIGQLDSITYTGDVYKIAFNYSRFKHLTIANMKADWIINTAGERIMYKKDKDTNNKAKYIKVNLTEEFDKLFEEYNIDKYGDIIEQIINADSAKLYDKFLTLFRLVLTFNNSFDDEYLYISPVEGSIYNRKMINADCVGSYNIARKGLMAVEKITASNEDFVKITSNKDEWITYAQKHLQK